MKVPSEPVFRPAPKAGERRSAGIVGRARRYTVPVGRMAFGNAMLAQGGRGRGVTTEPRGDPPMLFAFGSEFFRCRNHQFAPNVAAV